LTVFPYDNGIIGKRGQLSPEKARNKKRARKGKWTMASKNKQIVASKSNKPAKPVKSNKPAKVETLANVEPISAPQALAKVETAKAEPVKPEVKEVPDGYGFFSALDTVTGILFVTMQALVRAYVSALICDSPAGVIVARWSSNHKALLRTAKAIEAGKGTAGLSNPRVVAVTLSEAAPENALATSRRREVEYYSLMGLVGPNHAARELAKAARIAAQAAKAATQAASAPSSEANANNA
jgi:hypothetical protein